MLDTVADLCSASSKRENRHWGLVLVEVLAPLLAQHKPADIAQTEVLSQKKSERASTRKDVDDRLERAAVERDEAAVEKIKICAKLWTTRPSDRSAAALCREARDRRRRLAHWPSRRGTIGSGRVCA